MIDDFKQVPPKEPTRLGPPDNSSYKAGQAALRSFGGDQDAVNRPAPQFRTPEETAVFGTELPAPSAYGNTQQDKNSAFNPPLGGTGGGSGDKPPKSPKTPGKPIVLFGKWTIPRKKFFIGLAILAILLSAAGVGAYSALKGEEAAPAKPVTKTKPAPPPPPIVSPLTGVTVDDKAKTNWQVIGAMIENSPNARPQSGLKSAGIVYEAIAEAGITRFLALYQEDRPGNVGPIRSARPYYLDWAMASDATYAHVGGSPDALARIKAIGTKDLDQFFNPSAYHRTTNRFAPHNVYTSVAQLAELSASKGWTSSQFTPLARKADKPFVAPAAGAATDPKTADTRAAANAVDLGISSALYNVHYDYEAATNSYKRVMAGAPHMDADSNTQLASKVVVALVMPYSVMADGYHSQYATTGTGKMFVFQDGTVQTGSWTKGEPKSQFEFKDDSGAVLKLNAGQTWFSIVGDAGKVTYR